MSLRRFLDRMEPASSSLLIVNRTAPNPVREMVEDLFGEQPVSVDELDVTDVEDDMVLLAQGGEVTATSPLQALTDAIFFVNSDLYVTGTRGLEDLEVPDVIEGLSEVPFRLQGYPESNNEKLLLILVSRLIERRAVNAGDGTLRVSFQRLSRLKDEVGTLTVYEHLAQTDVDVHLYGVPDTLPPQELDVVVHGGYGEDFRDAWFVLYQPPADSLSPMGLLCIEVEPRTWRGFWTEQPGLIDDVAGYIRETL